MLRHYKRGLTSVLLVAVCLVGGYGCSVSIRSGSGSGTTDRVVRLPRRFQDRLAAAAYALEEGLRWISASPGLRPA